MRTYTDTCGRVRSHTHCRISVSNITLALLFVPCVITGLDTKQLYTSPKALESQDDRRELLMRMRAHFRRFDPTRMGRLLAKPTAGQLWQADHIVRSLFDMR
jgi:hypothetical protein